MGGHSGRGRRIRHWRLGSAVATVALVASACGSGSSSSSGSSSTSGTGANANQTVVFAAAGLGTEEQATQTAANDFEKLHPNIHIRILALSSNSTQFLHQIEQRFSAGSNTPDVIESDVTYPATFAKAGWIAPLDKYGPDLSRFFPGQVKAGQYQGKTYAIPWFINPEGLFYRPDLVPSPPTTPTQLVQEAQAALQKDPLLKEGLAFAGDKYEGAITAFMCFEGVRRPAQLERPQHAAEPAGSAVRARHHLLQRHRPTGGDGLARR